GGVVHGQGRIAGFAEGSGVAAAAAPAASRERAVCPALLVWRDIGLLAGAGQPRSSLGVWRRWMRPVDVNWDGGVDLADLATVLADFDCVAGACSGDADGDGDTDLGDLGLVLAYFGD
ncbi:MAG: hypothetical protein D6744_08550, partial [Planctomycetota bacterium]